MGKLSDVWVVGNQRWRPMTGSRQELTYISARIHNSNESQKAIPMFSESDNTERLVGKLSDVWLYCKSQMAAINRKLIGINVYLSSYTQ